MILLRRRFINRWGSWSHRYHTVVASLSNRCRSGPERVQTIQYWTAVALLSLQCRFYCQSEGSHDCTLKRHNQGNAEHRWLSGACVFLLRGVFDFAENSQGGILLTLIIALSDCSWIRGIAEIVDKNLGSKITVVPSRGIIRVTVTIGNCQALVSSSSEGCSTWQKTVKVEAWTSYSSIEWS